MKNIIFFFIFLTPFYSFSQDTSLTYTKVLTFDSTSKNDIFDKALIWCSKSFKESKCAINVKEREGGIISGKAYIKTPYYIHKPNSRKPDSTLGYLFNDYKFDWLIEVKNNKLRFSISNLLCVFYSSTPGSEDILIIVNKSENVPYKNPFISDEKLKLHWKLSKESLLNQFDLLMLTLKDEVFLAKQKDDW